MANPFWEEKIGWREHGNLTPSGRRAARINGQHYIIEPDLASGNRSMAGYCGQKFVIQFLGGDKATVTTRNLWGQGTIPEELRAALPDNARFLKEER